MKLVGTKHGRLTIIAKAGISHLKKKRVRCECECGNRVEVDLQSLRSGNTRSCGCYWREVVKECNRTHGMTGTALYNTWRGMKSRCLNKNADNYRNYGGRGIKICTEWMSFDGFHQWAVGSGYKRGLTIERIDNDGDYCPENCQWDTRLQQNNNRRSSHRITFNGKTRTIAAWARVTGIPRTTTKRTSRRSVKSVT